MVFLSQYAVRNTRGDLIRADRRLDGLVFTMVLQGEMMSHYPAVRLNEELIQDVHHSTIASQQEKPPPLVGGGFSYRKVAGIGFEPMTFGL